MRGSLVHDALYQLMRDGHLDRATHREAADPAASRPVVFAPAGCRDGLES